MSWLKLIRWNNLIIVLLTQLLAWWCVLMPVWYNADSEMLLGPVNFICLALSTVLITAAGYIINDYFDIKIDLINKPDKVVLENTIPRRQAILLHTILNITGIALAAFVAVQAGHVEWVMVQVITTLLLWFYSTHFKRQFMTGNIIVALLTALTIIILIVYEPSLHKYITMPGIVGRLAGATELNPVWMLSVYAYFAFMLTWMREIVKDMEDHKGDAEQGCVTMPIKWGLKRSARFVQVLGVLTIIPLTIIAVKLYRTEWSMLAYYTLFVLVLPLGGWLYSLNKKATTAHYHIASTLLKFIMMLGITSLLVYYCIAWVRSY